ncbi:uncharacterized protein LOC133315386 [Gastrolobium bilobum]|uniref:uncharacterized protein LOC133315386 n=1 Tax=Gastrolobium bilobum TaxID=150636 RepID=UPI002AB11220|nr:uncharacterized protein LOC133315386 [Gastrolobium bilobum]
MDGRDSWRVAACGGDGAAFDNKILNRIMLRFRPIAPKPVAGSSDSAGGDVQVSQINKVEGKRSKRKYVRVRRNSGYARKKGNRSSERKDGVENVAVVTLQLMPEKDAPERGEVTGDSWRKNVDLDLTVEKIQILEDLNPPCATANADVGKGLDRVVAEAELSSLAGASWCKNVGLDNLTVEKVRFMDNLKPPCATANAKRYEILDQVVAAAEMVVVESWVTVESVTGTCMGEGEGEGLGCTDVEKVKNLETDTCPGFVSDGCYKVRWVNDAYKRMVVGEEPWPEIVVWLKVKDSVEWCCYSYPAFTCGVRLQYTWRNEKCTKMVPCDVWRLDCGGFAWKLDVKAALSLGL